MIQSLLSCPVCKRNLNKQGKTFSCQNKHSFDEAKEGYVNLYHNHSTNAGDDATMLMARSQFLNQGYYQGIAESLKQLVKDLLKSSNQSNFTILDAGCGEGYYLNYLHNQLVNEEINCQYYGFDISKKAVKMCSKKNQNIEWFVANANDIPIQDHTIDCFINMFSYYNPKEVERVLAKKGTALIFRASRTHLLELKEILYPELLLKDSDIDVKGSHLNCIDQKNYKNKILINHPEDIKHLLQMTPHVYKTNRENQAQLEELDSLELTLDIDIYVLKQK
jgi:23S rRNA (guanine745-N1)-methyltransferase